MPSWDKRNLTNKEYLFKRYAKCVGFTLRNLLKYEGADMDILNDCVLIKKSSRSLGWIFDVSIKGKDIGYKVFVGDSSVVFTDKKVFKVDVSFEHMNDNIPLPDSIQAYLFDKVCKIHNDIMLFIYNNDPNVKRLCDIKDVTHKVFAECVMPQIKGYAKPYYDDSVHIIDGNRVRLSQGCDYVGFKGWRLKALFKLITIRLLEAGIDGKAVIKENLDGKLLGVGNPNEKVCEGSHIIIT